TTGLRDAARESNATAIISDSDASIVETGFRAPQLLFGTDSELLLSVHNEQRTIATDLRRTPIAYIAISNNSSEGSRAAAFSEDSIGAFLDAITHAFGSNPNYVHVCDVRLDTNRGFRAAIYALGTGGLISTSLDGLADQKSAAFHSQLVE